MYLLLITTALSFITVSTPYFTQPLITWLKRPNKKERNLYEEAALLKKEQAEISITENFAAHAKLQRKINNIEKQLKKVSEERSTNSYIFPLCVTYGIKVTLYILVLFLIIYYRYTPVYILPDDFNCYPLDNIISYPNKETGAISFHCWLLVSNTVARILLK